MPAHEGYVQMATYHGQEIIAQSWILEVLQKSMALQTYATLQAHFPTRADRAIAVHSTSARHDEQRNIIFNRRINFARSTGDPIFFTYIDRLRSQQTRYERFLDSLHSNHLPVAPCREPPPKPMRRLYKTPPAPKPKSHDSDGRRADKGMRRPQEGFNG
eukprot:7610680-Pyramimonas_sp.AAC.1